jgi:hypothetical protein
MWQTDGINMDKPSPLVPHRQEMPSGELSSAPAMEIQSQIISENNKNETTKNNIFSLCLISMLYNVAYAYGYEI